MKDKELTKKNIVKIALKSMGALRFTFLDYMQISSYPKAKIGDWAIEVLIPRTTIECILKLTKVDTEHGNYEGIDMLGVNRKWKNCCFYPLPRSAQEYLNKFIKE